VENASSQESSREQGMETGVALETGLSRCHAIVTVARQAALLADYTRHLFYCGCATCPGAVHMDSLIYLFSLRR